MTIRRVALRPARAAARSSRSILIDEAERTIDGFLAGRAPEAVARQLAQHQVIERLVAEFAARTVADEQYKAQVDQLAERVVRSDAFRAALYDVVASAELRRAVADQSAGLAAEIAAVARRRLVDKEDALESHVHHLLRRPTQPAQAPRPGGVATRGGALVVDLALAQLLFLFVSVSVVLIWSLVGAFVKGPTAWGLAGGGWLVVAAVYFVGFWSSCGQTPGLRIMHLRVVTNAGATPSFARSSVRFVGLILAILPLLAGFLPALVDGRRRALQDFLAGTYVIADGPA